MKPSVVLTILVVVITVLTFTATVMVLASGPDTFRFQQVFGLLLPLLGISLTSVPRALVSSGQEYAEQKLARMRQFWADNPKVVYLGYLFASKVNGKTIAETIAEGGSVEIGNELELDGKKFPLAKPLTFSIRTIADWGCISCGSAHGSKVGPSKRDKADTTPSAKLLADNRFFYSLREKRVFVISWKGDESCWSKYVDGIPEVKRDIKTRFVPLAQWEPLPVTAVASETPGTTVVAKPKK